MAGTLHPLNCLPFFLLLFWIPSTVCWCYYTSFSVTQEASIIDYCSDNTRIAITSLQQQQAFIYDPIYYTVMHTISVAGRNVQTARFTKDTHYLAVGLDNGTVLFLTGKPPYSNTPLFTVDVESGKKIRDIGFNSNSVKMIVCFEDSASKSFYIVNNYAGTSPNIDSQGLTTHAKGCKLSEKDEAVLIDTNKRAYIYDIDGSGNIAASSSTNFNDNNRFMDLDVRRIPGTSATKVVVANEDDDRGGYFLDGAGSYTQCTFNNNPGDKMWAACFSPKADYYAFGGKDHLLYIFEEPSNSNVGEFSQPLRDIQSCTFSEDGEYLLAGIVESGGSSLVYIWRQNCNEACPAGFYANGTYNCTPCAMAIDSCSLCLDASICMACFQGYYVNMTTYSCVTCNSAMAGCSTCADSVTCIECNPGYYLSSSDVCEACSALQAGCLSCNSTFCHICSLSYYDNAGTCTLCSISNCLRCTASNVCIDCQLGYYIASAGSSCSPCDSICFTCDSSSSNCTTCISGYYSNNYACTSCPSGCSACTNASSCLMCSMGYYESSGSCSTCQSPCLQCTNQTACTACTLGYYLSSIDCLICQTGCASCDNSTSCLSCLPGHYLLNNTCVACSDMTAGCALCNSTTCLECVSTYYANGGGCDSCATVIEGCETCSNSTLCHICAVGHYHTGGSGSSACDRCPSHCLTCNDSSTCFSCQVGYYLLANNSCASCDHPCVTCSNSSYCFSCVLGYYLDSVGDCLSCSNLSNCLTCSNASYCISCAIGFYQSSGICSQCDSNCLHCNATECLACSMGYYPTSDNYTCSPCPVNCSRCENATNCVSCSLGYFHNSSLTDQQCTTCTTIDPHCLTCDQTACFACSSGRFLSGGGCLLCSNITDRCLECSGSDCLACQGGYYLFNNTCSSCSLIAGCILCTDSTTCLLCSSGFFLDSNSSCSPCLGKCSSCNDSVTCTACAPSYYYDTGSSACLTCLNANLTGCVTCYNTTYCLSCQGGHYLNNGQCKLCNSAMQGCLLCANSSSCSSCQQGYFSDGGSCSLCASTMKGCLLCNETEVCHFCDTGYYLQTSGSNTTCSSCAMLSGCYECENSTWCSNCLSGYYQDNGSCLLCDSISKGCIFCDNSTACVQCKSGYYLESGSVCTPCANAACEVCLPSNSSLCITCNSGYYMAGNQTCSPCAVNCLTCNKSACTLCSTGYYLNSTQHTCHLCSQAIIGCGKCSSDTACLECESMFYLNSSNQCTLCGETILGCGVCSGGSTCLNCDGGFYLSSNGSCGLCADITGCLICNSSSHCLACDTTYYQDNGGCSECSSSIPNCFECSNATTCTACETGYSANATNCSEATFSSGSGSGGSTPSPSNDLQFTTYYIDTDTLKHVLASQDMTFSNFDLTTTADIIITLELGSNPIVLTIRSVALQQDDHAACFYTNNPLNSLDFKRVPSVTSGRFLAGQSVQTDSNSGISVPQATLGIIMPDLRTTSAYSSSYSLDDPEFYSSYIKEHHQMYYYLVGVIYLAIWAIYCLVRAYHFPHLTRHSSEILPHLLAVKTVPLVIYPTYAEYISYALGFMAIDLPWLNQLLPSSMADPLDYAPKGFYYYFTNMNFAAMSLVTFAIYLLLLGFSYMLCADSRVEEVKLSTTDKLTPPNLLFNAFKEFLVNFFNFGVTFAGFCSLVGSLHNSTSVISLNGFFYIMGVLVVGGFATEAFYRLVTQKEIGRSRVVFKAGLLAGATTNPIYLAAVAIVLDVILMVVEFCLRKENLVCRKGWMACQIMAQLSLMMFYFLPDSLLTIILTALLAVLVLPIDVYMTCYQVENSQEKTVNELGMSKTQQKLWNASSADLSSISDGTEQLKETKLVFGSTIDFEDRPQQSSTKGGSFSPTRRSRRFRNVDSRNTNALQVRRREMMSDLESIDEEGPN